jgi:hypothetical protein
MKQVSTRSASKQSEMFRFAQHDRGTALAFWGAPTLFVRLVEPISPIRGTNATRSRFAHHSLHDRRGKSRFEFVGSRFV